MAKRNGGLQLADYDVLRIARIRASESAASTFTQTEFDTQLSIERGVIWLIHFIEFNISQLGLFSEVGAGGGEDIQMQITKTSQSAILSGNNADIIQQHRLGLVRGAAIGTDAGPLYYFFDSIKRFDYHVPIPYAAANLYFGILGTDAGSAHTVDARIGYTIAEVSDEFFFRVAQALVG